MRQDIDAAYRALDSKGQSSITGMRSPGSVKKAFQQLAGALPDESVLAVAVGFDDGPSMNQQRQLGAGGSLSAIGSMMSSYRLLVLSGQNVHEMQAAGRRDVNSVRTPLLNITDVRVRTKQARIGPNTRFLAFDHMRGMQLETKDIAIETDSQLTVFSSRLRSQLEIVHQEAQQAEAARQQPVIVQPQISVADELQKLAGLRDSGIVTQAEFDQQKAKLLSSG